VSIDVVGEEAVNGVEDARVKVGIGADVEGKAKKLLCHPLVFQHLFCSERA